MLGKQGTSGLAAAADYQVPYSQSVGLSQIQILSTSLSTCASWSQVWGMWSHRESLSEWSYFG